MDTLECIISRRSIRRFTDQELEDDTIIKLLEAVRHAPSWKNNQCWEVVIVRDRERKEQLMHLLTANNPAAKSFLQAPLVFVMCAQKGKSGYEGTELATNKGEWLMFDMGIACQNLCLTAHAMGLGAVHVGSFDSAGLDRLLDLPADIVSVEMIPVGYPARIGNAPPRKAITEFAYLETFGKKFLP